MNSNALALISFGLYDYKPERTLSRNLNIWYRLFASIVDRFWMGPDKNTFTWILTMLTVPKLIRQFPDMIACHIIVAWKINFNIFNATTFAMRHQGPSILDNRFPPIPPLRKTRMRCVTYGSHSKHLCTVYATVSFFMFTTFLRST